jgi:hypothetical protein
LGEKIRCMYYSLPIIFKKLLFHSKVVRRPFAFIYNHEKDPVERALINLGTARIEFNDEDIANGTRV